MWVPGLEWQSASNTKKGDATYVKYRSASKVSFNFTAFVR